MAAELRPKWARKAIRTLCAEDAAAVAEILRQSPEAVFWPEASVKEVLEWQEMLGMASEADGKLAGFLIARQAKNEAEVLNLAVAPERRRQGDGAALLRAAFASLHARGVSRVFLEVRESNAAAIAFYGKHGFSKSGQREGYYREPFEAAIVMEKKLTG
jgi:[ribosomal protein S18]-alanine N-acetyltransferase